MPRVRPGARLTVIVGTELWHHRPVSHEIVRRARAAGLAGATVLRGIEGFGSSGVVHTARILSLADDLPQIVIIVDTEDRVRDFLGQLDGLYTGGLTTIEPVEIVEPDPPREWPRQPAPSLD